MYSDISGLRWLAIIIGIVIIIAAVVWGRKRKHGTTSPLIMVLFGFGLLFTGVFPVVARILADVLFQEDMKGGGLIILLIISSILLWLIMLWNRSKAEFLRDRLNSFINTYVVESFVEDVNEELENNCPICVVIPAFEEEENIGDVLASMPSEVFKQEVKVIVVDDGSKDETGKVARDYGAYVLRMPINSGQGSALKAGYHAAIKLGADVVVTLDADGQNLSSEIGVLAEVILTGEADVVIGSRVLGDFEKSAVIRTVGVYLFNTLLTILTGSKITDCASSIRAFSRRVLVAAQLREEQYQSTEILIEAARRKYKIVERPITWKKRQGGKTKKAHSLKYGFLFLRTIMKTWLR